MNADLLQVNSPSEPTMETQAEKHKPANSQLILVPHKDTARLLEVYVTRSLSLNDGTLGYRKSQKKEKWVTIPKRHRRHSSDPSLHLRDSSEDVELSGFSGVEPNENQPEPCAEPETLSKKSKKNKKPSFWKNLVEIFSRKSNEDKDEEQDSPTETSEDSDAAINCLPTTPVPSQKKSLRKKSMRRRFSKRRLSFIKPNKPGKDLNTDDKTNIEAVVSVEATYSYYENVSAELEKIIHEVKVKEEDAPLSNEELSNRIIALIKEEGDAIDVKLKDNPALNSFFQGMTYSSFQKLADAYLEKEAAPTTSPLTVPPTAPELVKLAFTLDFTARIASLSRQNVGHITGLGNRYLQDRFEYRQACTDHPWSDNED